jgi:hypothetical protein
MMLRWIFVALIVLALLLTWRAWQNYQTDSPPIIPPAAEADGLGQKQRSPPLPSV